MCMIRLPRRHLALSSPVLALVGAALAAPGAASAQDTAKIAVSTPGEVTVQVRGTDLADEVTVERVDGTRTVRITANRSISAAGACEVTGRGSAECVAPPAILNAIQPELGIVFGGSPVRILVPLEAGDDTLTFRRSGRDEDTRLSVSGGAGDDRISAEGLRAGLPPGVGNRAGIVMAGGPGDDTLVGGPGLDRLFGDAGDDELRGLAGLDQLQGGADDDTLLGGDGDDALLGGDDDDVLAGGAGIDRLVGGFGGDVLSGGADRDTTQYQELEFVPDPATPDPFDGTTRVVPRAGVQVTIGDRRCTDGGPEDATAGGVPALPVGIPSSCPNTAEGARRDEVLGDIEVLVGSRAADVLIGDASDETLVGDAGADQLEGGSGADALLGEDGDDTLLLRDDRTDLGAVCGSGARDRALADPADPVDPTCETVDRGSADLPAATGGATAPLPPVVAQPPGTVLPDPPAAPPAGEVATEATVIAEPTVAAGPVLELPVAIPAPAPADSAPTGVHSGGAGPGGGDDGKTPPEARLLSRVIAADRKGRAAVLLTCVYRARACRGTVSLRTSRAVRRGARRLGAGTVVGRATVDVPWGRTATVTVPLTRAARGVLAGRRTRVRVVAVVRDGGAGAGAAARRVSRTVTLAAR